MPENRPVVDIMRAYATANGCTAEAFSQVAVIGTTTMKGNDWGINGICYGLAVAWLEAIKNGKEGGFLDDTRTWTTSNAFARSHLIWRNQRSTGTWQKLVGLTPAVDSDGAEKSKTFPLTDQGMLEFAHWLSGSGGTRYFLVHVAGHSMAAAGSALGKLKFFDPNGGVVSATWSSSMAAFLKAYFNNEKIYGAYFPCKGQYRIEVEKFKKG